MIWRIAIFYVGSVVLLCLLMPYTAYKDAESPFVTFFDAIGIEAPHRLCSWSLLPRLLPH